MVKYSRLHAKEILDLIESIPMPTKLDIDNCKIAAINCKTVKEFCEFLDLKPVVFKQWCKQSIEYFKAYTSWREFATQDIEVALAKKAIGFTKKTERDVVTKTGQVVTLENETYYPPDTAAAQFWLKNMKPEDWKDKSEVDVNVNANIRAWLIAAGETVEEPELETIEGSATFVGMIEEGSAPLNIINNSNEFEPLNNSRDNGPLNISPNVLEQEPEQKAQSNVADNSIDQRRSQDWSLFND